MENPLTELQPGQPLDPAQLNNPPQPPSENDPNGKKTAADENQPSQGILQVLADAGNRVAQTIKRGRGRPRNDGAPKISDKIADAPPAGLEKNQIPANAPVPPVVNSPDNALFVEAVTMGVEGSFGICGEIVRWQANEAGIEPEFTDVALARCKPAPQALASWQKSFALVAKKYNWDFKYAPELMLATSTGRLYSPFALLLIEFRREIARKKAIEAQKITPIPKSA